TVHGDIPACCRFKPHCPLAFELCGWAAEEDAYQLRSLKADGLLPGAGDFEVSEAGTVRVSVGSLSADALVMELNALLSERRDAYLPLKGIAEVRAANGAIELSLHESSEPPLLEIEPGNFVACHLVTHPSRIGPSVTAC